VAADKEKVYGTDDPELTATVTGAVDGDTINYTLAREAGEDVGTYDIVVTLGENPNYEVSKTDATFTITKATVTVVAADKEKVCELLLDCAKANELVLDDPAPEALVTVTEGGLPSFKLRTWFKSGDYWTVYFGLNEAVQKALTENQLPLAHQQVDLHTDK
jgi:small-conductance mechanosensitive channel